MSRPQSSARPLEVRQNLLAEPAYPLPGVVTIPRPSSSHRTASKRSLVLGINEQTGRLQWCPNFKCCKFLIILPVVLLPVTIILVLLMRMDGMLLALRLQKQNPGVQPETAQQTGNNVPIVNINEAFEKAAVVDDGFIVDEQMLLPYHRHRHHPHQQRYFHGDDQQDENWQPMKGQTTQLVSDDLQALATLSERERIRRCLSYHYGQSETIDVEDRDLMKDARTSFLPADTLSTIPRECFETLDDSSKTVVGGHGGNTGAGGVGEDDNGEGASGDAIIDSTEGMFSPDMLDYQAVIDFLRSRQRRTSDNSAEAIAMNPEETTKPDEEQSINEEHSAMLESFWNEQGTKESIREAQSRTMQLYMDPKVNPCDDFYRYACGNWKKVHPIPRDKAGFDTFEMLRENLDAVLKQLLEARETEPGRPEIIASLKPNKFKVTDQTADIIKASSTGKQMDSEDLMPTDNSTQTILEEQEKARLRRHIIEHRSTLGRLLERYRQQTATSRNRRKRSIIQSGLPDNQDLQKDEEQAKAKLRSYIVQHRTALGHLLYRYRRQTTTNTKRKRLISTTVQQSSTLLPVTSRPSFEGIIHNIHHIPLTSTEPKLFSRQRDLSYAYEEPSAQVKAKYLYESCTNTKLLQKRGIQPLLELINRLGGWPVLDPHWDEQHFDWLNLTAHLRRFNNDILIVQWVGPDIKNSDENVIQFDQTTLGLPTRDYFLHEANAKYLQAYQTFMADVINRLGASQEQSQETAKELVQFETQLARITSPAEMRMNVTKLYKRMTLNQLNGAIPDIDWTRYLSILQNRNVAEGEEVVIYATDYMNELIALLRKTDKKTVANYLMWRFVRHRINNVDDRFEDTKQTFYHVLFGREESPQRWKICIAQVNTNMGMALGAMFVSKYFDDNSKRDTLRMTHELQQAFRDNLQSADWIDPETKHLAELKVNAMSLKIGYPDFILNANELNAKYAGLTIHPQQYFENTLDVLLHTAQQEQNKLHETVNKTTWQTAPAIVNAYYSRNKNQIMFPAGILQPPFYHHYFPRSLNFGGIGVVIGHELTHGFDDKGRLFDRHGSIQKWWSDAAIKNFDERARCIIAQYGNYTVTEVGIPLNGESTQGENIADNGGLRQSFHAYKSWLNANPDRQRDERLPGLDLTGPQLFFLNFGQVWCGAMRPEAVRNKLNTAIHSPGRFRVIGTLSNSKDFAQQFNCPIGSPMNPANKCSVW